MNTIGRNDPCPCGSGKNYKKCCLPRQTPATPGRPADVEEELFTAEMRPWLDKTVDRLLQRMELGEGTGLKAELQALLEANPDYHLTNYAMGVYLATVEKDAIGPIPFLEKAVRVFPPLAEGHFNLGHCYVRAGRIAEAVAAFRKAIRYSDGDGIAAMAQQALRQLEQTIQKTSPFKTVEAFVQNQKLFDLGFENLKDRNYQKAIDLFSQVLERNPGHVQSYGNMGLAYAGLGRKAAAMQCLEKALALDPSYEPALLNKKSLSTMTEGEPNAPAVFEEIEYYSDRLDPQKSSNRNWWSKVKFWSDR